MTYLTVRNWPKYQHYKDRKPPWVKFYIELLDDVEMRRLPYTTRLLWDQLLLLAGRYENAIVNDIEEISMMVRMDREAVAYGLEQLLEGRWIKETTRKPRASKPLAEPEQDASPRARPRARGEAEAEAEKEELPGSGSPPSLDSRNGTADPENDFEKELEVQRLLKAVTGKDNRSADTFRYYARQLPVGAIAKVRESSTGKSAAYACGALKSEVEEKKARMEGTP